MHSLDMFTKHYTFYPKTRAIDTQLLEIDHVFSTMEKITPRTM